MLDDLFSLPFRVLKLPANLAAELCAGLDPDDYAGIRSAARALADAANIPMDAALRAINRAMQGED